MTTLKDRLREARLDREAVQKRVLPLVAHYGREPDFEARRSQFYADMAKAYRWERVVEPALQDGRAGRDGRPAEIASIGLGRAMPVITNAAPLEYLFGKGLLQGPRDAHGTAHRRLNAGQRLRGIWEGAQISGLKAANYEGASGGGSPGKLPGEHKMDCIMWLAELRGKNKTPGLEQSPFSMVEDVVVHDIWIWEKVRADRRDKVITKLQKALDELSVRLFMMTMRDFNARWYPGRPLVAVQESPDPSQDQASSPSGLPSQSDEPRHG